MSFMFRCIKKLIPHQIFTTLQPMYHLMLAFLAAIWYGFPSRRMVVIGVTGTKGKTTVVELLHAIFAEAGVPSASLSSYAFRINNRETRNDKKMTMPGRFFVQKFLYDAKKEKCRFAVLEVTSEGIKQYRHRFINFYAAVLTNIAPEHIESHGGFEPYLRAKLDLFWRLPHDGFAIINSDDNQSQRFVAATGAKKIWYGKDEIDFGSKKFVCKNREIKKDGVSFTLDGEEMESPLAGEFNFSNIFAAVSTVLAFHIAKEKIASALSRFKGVPGRMEYVMHEPYEIVVDYAHTPDSLKSVYQFLKPKSGAKLICVLGAAGGGRDKWKRPEFGKIAAEFCDEIILTNEDPYDENQHQILSEIESGVSESKKTNCKKILDRREAIQTALKSGKTGDVVIITGKGSEPWIMGPKGTKIPWDDRGVVKEEYQKRI